MSAQNREIVPSLGTWTDKSACLIIDSYAYWPLLVSPLLDFWAGCDPWVCYIMASLIGDDSYHISHPVCTVAVLSRKPPISTYYEERE